MTRRKNKTPKSQQLAASQSAKPQAVLDESCESPLRPWLLCGMTAVLVARPLFPSEAAATNGDGLSIVMLWIALGVFWLLGPIGRRKFSLRLGWTDTAVLLLVVWTTVAALWAVRHGAPRPAINMLWEWVGMGMCFFLARQFLVTPRERRAVAAVMVALAVGISGYGLYQCCYELRQTQAQYEADPDQALRTVGLWYPPDSPERKAFEDRLANRQPTATFALTNSLAAFLTPWAVMLVGAIAASVRNRKRLAAMLACLVPIAACLILTKSRSGYAGACVGILLVWLCGRGDKKGDSPIFAQTKIGTVPWKAPAALAGIAIVVLSAALVVEGPAVLGRASKSFGYRLQYWQSTLKMIADHPWLGCGPGNFQDTYTQYKLPEASEEIADPHNFLLEIWATAGTPAVLAFLAVLGCFVIGIRGQGSEVRVQGSGFSESAAGQVRSEPLTASLQSAINNQQSTIPNLKSQISDPASDAWLHVLGGGVLGFLLSIPLGILSAAPPSPAALLIGLPLAVATVALMFGWVRKGRLPRWLPGVGVVAILIALLAAGGIAMPSVAATFWLLLALGLEGQRQHFLRASTAWAALAGLLIMAGVCYSTAYEPVLHCQAELRMAEQQPTRAVAHLEAAAAADPLSAEPWRQLASIEFETWARQPDEATFRHFTHDIEKVAERAPHSADLWMTVGDWQLRAFSINHRRGKRLASEENVQAAIGAYSRAVRLYPNSAMCHARLAEAYLATVDRAAFAREAETALRLDRITPHKDKKLPLQLRDRLSAELKRS
jgi:O-antigen ligase